MLSRITSERVGIRAGVGARRKRVDSLGTRSQSRQAQEDGRHVMLIRVTLIRVMVTRQLGGTHLGRRLWSIYPGS